MVTVHRTKNEEFFQSCGDAEDHFSRWLSHVASGDMTKILLSEAHCTRLIPHHPRIHRRCQQSRLHLSAVPLWEVQEDNLFNDNPYDNGCQYVVRVPSSGSGAIPQISQLDGQCNLPNYSSIKDFPNILTELCHFLECPTCRECEISMQVSQIYKSALPLSWAIPRAIKPRLRSIAADVSTAWCEGDLGPLGSFSGRSTGECSDQHAPQVRRTHWGAMRYRTYRGQGLLFNTPYPFQPT